MTIKQLAASFGSLLNRELNLEEGFNIVTAPNEAGKSTWCGFIRAMLYGINTSERDKQDRLSEKTRYRPWSGAAMEGRMELVADGREITIQRTGLGQIPMKKLSVVYSKTGQEVLELANENLGETLTGVSEKVFERSAFIRQSGLKVEQTGELESRISALVSSGDETLSYTETDETLRAWLRKRRHNKTGQIPKLDEQLVEVEDALENLSRASHAFGEISLNLDRVTTRMAELTTDLNIHEELEHRGQRQKISDAGKRVRDLEHEVRTLQAGLTRDNTEISREMVAAAREQYDQLGALTMSYTEMKAEKEAAEQDIHLIDEERAASIFEGKDISDAREIVAGAAEEDLKAEQAAQYKKEKYTVPTAIFSVVALVGVVFSFLLNLPLFLISIPAVAIAVIEVVLLYRKKGAAARAEARRQETLSTYKSGSIADLTLRLEDYERLSRRSDELHAKYDGTTAACDAAMEDMQRRKDSFEEKVRAFAPHIKGLEDAFKVMSDTEKLAERLQAAQGELRSITALYEDLCQRYDGDPLTPIPRDGLRAPLRSKAETSYERKRTGQELEALKNSYAAAGGELKALGDPVVLGAKRCAVEARRAELTEQYDALAMAVEVLDESSREIQARFSPKLGRKAGAHLDRLTEGRYKRLVLDKDLRPQAEEFGASVSREVLYLSGGTVDQIYLALRLAICDMVLPADRPCPIILDDALINFDDERLASALDLLKDISKERQVILFTCQQRERDYFSDDAEVHLTSLPGKERTATSE